MKGNIKRLVATSLATALLAVSAIAPAVSAAPPGGSSRNVTVDGVETFTVSAGESVPFTLTISNGGKQNLNSVTLLFGLDDDIDPFANGDASPPVPFADTFSITTTHPDCTGGTTLSCAFATSLRARSSFSVPAVISASTSTLAGTYLTEAVASLAEGGGDAGYNIDTFSDQGTIDIVEFSCDSITAYRPGTSSSTKEVATPCAIGDAGNTNGQASKVRIPSRLTTVALSEVSQPTCSVVVSGYTCIGDLVVADVAGDATSDVITWTIQHKLNGVSINLNKLQVYHETDAQQLTAAQDGVLIALTKKNACKTTSQVNCGSASVDGDILTIIFQTAGNGSSRTLRG